MGEMMKTAVDPGMFEHVTKMGRIGGGSQSKSRSRAHFRQIPYQGPAPPITHGTPSMRSVSPSSTRVEDVEDNSHISHNTSVLSISRFDHEDVQPIPQPKPIHVRQPFHYEEMRLGRNMRAAPRGFSAQMAGSNAAPDSDVSEPLLNFSTANQPTNLVVDYLANTHPASVCQPTTTTRAITSPQHPSQHLIEMLNRNQHYSSELHYLERKQEEEEEQCRLPQEQDRHDREKEERMQQVLAAQRRYEQDILRQREKEKVSDTSGASVDRDDFHRESLGFTAEAKESLVNGSTQPFSPKASASYDYTMATSSSSGTRGQAVSMERNDVTRQETSEDVNEIEEDIVDNIDTGKKSDSDDGFNF